MKNIIILTLGVLFFTSCLADRYIDADKEPMLQLDAVFTAGEVIPEIKVRQVFKATGDEVLIINRNQLWANGATVTLMAIERTPVVLGQIDTVKIPVIETLPGRFRAQNQNLLVTNTYRYHVEVSWNDLNASAVAEIPLYDISGLEITTQTPVQSPNKLVFMKLDAETGVPGSGGERDTLIYYTVPVQVKQQIPFSFVAINMSTSSEIQGAMMYPFFRMDIHDPDKFSSHHIEELDFNFTYQRNLYAMYPHNSDPEDRDDVDIRITVVVPESIYADYIRLQSDYMFPVTITNVTGGVGLFIGARRDVINISVPLPAPITSAK